MTTEEINALLYQLPENVDYTSFAYELDTEDIAPERIEKLKTLLHHHEENIVFEAAMLLTHWGIDEGFDKLNSLYINGKTDGYYSHHLHGYDQTDEHILHAVVDFWASQSDAGNEQHARAKIFPFIKEIIHRAESKFIHIKPVFRLVEKQHYSEYIPLIQSYLQTISHKKETHNLQIKDTEAFLGRIEKKL